MLPAGFGTDSHSPSAGGHQLGPRQSQTMRGIPNHPIKCSDCNRRRGCRADGLCHGCRIRRRPPASRKFSWTPALDQHLTRCYRAADTRFELSRNLDSLQRLSGFTRVVILNRAAQLGLAFSKRRPWTPDECEFLALHAGRNTAGMMARRLNRTHASVTAKLKQMELSARITEGYSLEDLRQLLGVSAVSVRKWVEWGWLRLVDGRIAESRVIRFLRQHPDQYQLGRVDEAWFKGVLFPVFNGAWQRPGTAQHARSARLCNDPLALAEPATPSQSA